MAARISRQIGFLRLPQSSRRSTPSRECGPSLGTAERALLPIFPKAQKKPRCDHRGIYLEKDEAGSIRWPELPPEEKRRTVRVELNSSAGSDDGAELFTPAIEEGKRPARASNNTMSRRRASERA